ncbi:SMP-30/gluconolactonase/LRE family protein [Acetobacteraceae bacterium]|nr:SMP-30/gluconolactonase/LRE family protein [Acetobacteraceae bacterium]
MLGKHPYFSLFLIYFLLLPVTSKSEEVTLPLLLETSSPEFSKLISKTAKLRLIYDQAAWAEGPVQLKDGSILFSDIPNNRLLRYQPGKGVSVFLKPSQFQNGHALDKKGRILTASHGRRAIERLGKNGTCEVLVDLFEEKKLNSPNDLVVDKEGEIWFTDPSFGIDFPQEGYGGNKVIGGEYSYRYSPKTKKIVRLETPLVHTPNGIGFSPDGKILYLSDCERAHHAHDLKFQSALIAYDIAPDKSLKNGRILAHLKEGNADGLKIDQKGNIWLAAGKKIVIFTAQGKEIGAVHFPETVGNLLLTRNKKGKNILYVTASKSLYALEFEINVT